MRFPYNNVIHFKVLWCFLQNYNLTKKGFYRQMADILSSKFIKKYKKELMSSIQMLYPSVNKDKMESLVDSMIKESFSNIPVTLDNNYIGETKNTSLLTIFDWIIERNPIIAGNGTFYKNQDEAENPIAQMLDNFAAARKAFKKQMFSVDDTESYEYKVLDRSQLNEKINMNSWYGGSGAPSAAFYSKWSGPATTLSAQSVISTATAMFDAFLGDNHVYIDFDELMFWAKSVVEDYQEYEDGLDSWIVPATRTELVTRLYDKILNIPEGEEEFIHKLVETYVDSLSDDEVTYMFYKSNMVTFFERHDVIQNLFKEILWKCNSYPILPTYKDGEYAGTSELWILDIPKEFRDTYQSKHVKDWNKFASKEYFMDPNSIPDTIKSEVLKVKEYLIKYVFVRYLSFDRIYRLRNFKRRAAVIIDTDSNILTLDIIMQYIMTNIVGDESFGRKMEYNEFIVVNTLTATITDAIEKTLLFYGKQSNIPEKHRPRFDMKNEFFMSPVIIGDAKKRYISKIKLREGNLMSPAKIDVKGFDFKKATCSEYSEKYFMGLIKKHIIESETIDIPGLYRDIKSFEEEIHQSIINGENRFLPNASVKDLSGYKDPASEQSVRGYLAWNILHPDNPIEAPAKVSLVKMNIFTLDDIQDLKETNPDVYHKIEEKIFNDKTGIFVTRKRIPDFKIYGSKSTSWINQIPKKYQKEFKNRTVEEWNEFVSSHPNLGYEYKYRGMQVLAIPRNDKIPQWALPYVDMTSMINTIISPFRPVMKLFGNQTAIEGKVIGGVNRATEKITNIVKF